MQLSSREEDTPVSEPTERPQDVGQTGQRLFDKRTTMYTIMGAMIITFMSVLDQTVITTAIPHLVADLHSFALITWVTTIYLLTSTVTIPVYGKLSDQFGRKPIFLFSIIVFLTGSALSGASQTMEQLIFFRALQGVGAGGLQPIAACIIGDLFPSRERGKWQGLLGSMYALAAILGPFIGGLLTDSLSWRWVFYVNLPVGAIALLVLIFRMPMLRTANRRVSIDYLGAGLLVLGSLPLLLGFSWAGSQFDWASPQILGLLGSAVVMLMLLVIHCTRQERHGKEPVIEPSLFKANQRIFNVSLLATMAASIALMGSSYFIPLYIQVVTGATATNSGLAMLPMMLAAIGGSMIAGVLVTWTGRYKWIVLSGVVISIGGVLLLTRLTAHSGILYVIGSMGVLGLGLGPSLSVYTVIVQNALPRKIGQATALLTYSRQLGQSIGLAAMGSVVTASYVQVFSGLSPQLLRTIPARTVQAYENPLMLLTQNMAIGGHTSFKQVAIQGQPTLAPLFDVVKVSLTASIHNVFVLSLVMMIMVLVVVCFLKEIPLMTRKEMYMQAMREAALKEAAQREAASSQAVAREMSSLDIDTLVENVVNAVAEVQPLSRSGSD